MVKNWKEEHRSGQITYSAGKIEINAAGYYHIFAQVGVFATSSTGRFILYTHIMPC